MKTWIWITIIAFVAFIVLCMIFAPENTDLTTNPNQTHIQSSSQDDEISLIFKINETGENLNGEMFVNNKSLGIIKEGSISLPKEKLNISKFEIRVFYNNKTFSFFYDFDQDYLNYNPLQFIVSQDQLKEEEIQEISSSNVHAPSYAEEFKSFVRMNETLPYLQKWEIYPNKSNIYDINDDVDKIYQHVSGIIYWDDSELYHQSEYWATPQETLGQNKGDCEDWSIALVSLMKAYNYNYGCYVLLTNVHATSYCYFGNGNFVIYDQGRTRLSTKLYGSDLEQEKKAKIRTMRNAFFSAYGLSVSESDISYAFSDSEVIEFQTDDDFTSWAYNQYLQNPGSL